MKMVFSLSVGRRRTNVAGSDRIGVEVRGGISCPLFGRLLLDLSGKYTFIRLRDSNIEYQTMQNNFLATQSYVQGAPEYVTATQQFLASWRRCKISVLSATRRSSVTTINQNPGFVAPC